MESSTLDSVRAGVLPEEKALQHELLNGLLFRFHWGIAIEIHNVPNTGNYKIKKRKKVI